MHMLGWQGRRPSRELEAVLRRAGWQLGSPARVTVVRGEPRRRPGPWIFLCDEDPPARLLTDAADGGALDVVSTARPGWEARLVRRLGECLVDEPLLAPPPGFVAESPAARQLLRKIAQAAETSMPVLLTGETGTGKELAARYIHQASSRRARTFVPINCAAIPNELMESELFGYAKGAFSGAVRNYDGLVAAAEGGTVFLDEIDDTPPPLQQTLLRVLEDRVVSRLGESSWRKVDFRILAATNRDLRVLVRRGEFGQDLYERLATVQIELPPLRERPEDLPALVHLLIERYYAAEEEEAAREPRVRSTTPEVLAILSAYPWPGNVRELRNVIFGALVQKRVGDELLVSDLPRRLWARATPEGAIASASEIEQRVATGGLNLRRELEALERAALTAALRRTSGNAAAAARLLGEVGRGEAKDPGGTVRTMMKRLGITWEAP